MKHQNDQTSYFRLCTNILPADGMGVSLESVGEPETARARQMARWNLCLTQVGIHAHVLREL